MSISELNQNNYAKLQLALSTLEGYQERGSSKETTPEERDYLEADHHPMNETQFSEKLEALLPPLIKKLEGKLRSYVAMNLFFGVISFLELLGIVLFFSTLAQSSVLAISLAVPFLTAFSFFVLRIYFLTRKPEFFTEIRNEFLKSSKRLICYQEKIAEHHLALANAACKFASVLHNKEYTFYQPPKQLDFLAPIFEKFSCFWHWEDLHQMRELLLLCSVDEHIKLVKCEPTNLEVHAALANAYVMLSSLYSDPLKYESRDEERWVPPQQHSESMKRKFRQTAERAIEEFQILHNFAPNDPWVHAQLAYSYHDLQMPEKEIQEYETILKLRPDDRETQFKLGMLYFQQGHNAKGLRIYQELKGSNYKKAENLIRFYGAYSPTTLQESETE